MAEPNDLLLTDPSRVAVAAALDRVAPSPMRGRSRWSAILAEIDASREGRTQLETTDKGESGARYVSAAWWTDHRSVKYVRVCGGDTSSADWHPHYSRLDDDLRPPLWHVFVDRVYRVTWDESFWLVSCACGMTGTPEELAWMGTRCGPCHDRREEGAPHPDDGRPTLFVDRGEGRAVAFSHDGAWLAASSGGWHLRLYNVGNGERRTLSEWEDEPDVVRDAHGPVEFSPDGRWLAASLPSEWVINFWDLEGEQGESELMPPGAGEETRGLAFSPDGRLFATVSDHASLDLSTAEGGVVKADGPLPTTCTTFAFSPDGKRLALADLGGEIRVYDTLSWAESGRFRIEASPDEDVQFIQFTPDGRRLVLITSETRGIGMMLRSRLHLFDAERNKTIDAHDVSREIRVAALSPDGHYLATVVHDTMHSPGEVLFFDLVEWRDAGRLEWNPEDAINDLAFSGETLATISASGVVKLWPWRLLLEG